MEQKHLKFSNTGIKKILLFLLGQGCFREKIGLKNIVYIILCRI